MDSKLEIVVSAVDEASGEISNIQSQLNGLKNLGSSLQSAGLAMGAMGAAMSVPFIAGIKAATDFDASMRNVQAVSGATEEEFKRLSEAAKDFGEKTKYSAADAAQAMYAFGSAGFKTDQIIQATNGTMALAVATQATLGQAAETVTQTLNQFGINADKSGMIADVFSKAISGSALNMERLQAGMSYIGPLAGQLGTSLTETTAALMELNNAGLVGEKAGTGLREAFAMLLSPTAGMVKTFSELGISMDQVSPASHSLEEIIQRLAASGATTAQIMDIFGMRAGPAMALLVSQGVEALDKYKTALDNSGGAAQQMAETQMSGLAGTMERLKSTLETSAIAIGQAITPMITQLANALKGVLDWFNALPEPIKDFLTNVGAIAAGLLTVAGGAALFIGSIIKMIEIFGTAIEAIKAFSAAQMVLNLVMSANPIGIIILSIVALIAVIALVVTHWQEFSTFFLAVGKTISDAFGQWWDGMKIIFEGVMKVFTTLWDGYVEYIKTVLTGIWTVFMTIWGAISTFFTGVVDGIIKAWQGFLAFWQGLWTTIANIFNTVLDGIKSGINVIIDGINALLGALNSITGQNWHIPTLKLSNEEGQNININVSTQNTKDQIINAVTNALGDTL
ncbi:MAG: phage tail tape measure protein [Thermotogae bacterium]|jgi:TP901 family phage tail tape measure protein|nr:phage tail tape measure protein [Thermotogota bacterium]MCL5033082.1 phage tail tape measure protein [Thermotogota bacterium]